MTGVTFTDDAYKEYSVAQRQLMASSFDNATEVNELFDGSSYIDALKRGGKFNMSLKGLHLFYDVRKLICFSRRIVVNGFIGRFNSPEIRFFALQIQPRERPIGMERRVAKWEFETTPGPLEGICRLCHFCEFVGKRRFIVCLVLRRIFRWRSFGFFCSPGRSRWQVSLVA